MASRGMSKDDVVIAPQRQNASRSLDLRRSQSCRLSNNTSSTTKSITKCHALNHQLLSAFDTLFSTDMHQVACAIGMQFVETALLEIPKHGCFYSPRHEKDRTESSKEALRVTELLEKILNEETDEIKKKAQQEERNRLSRLQKLAQEQQTTILGTPDETLRKKYETQRNFVEEELRAQMEQCRQAHGLNLSSSMSCFEQFHVLQMT